MAGICTLVQHNRWMMSHHHFAFTEGSWLRTGRSVSNLTRQPCSHLIVFFLGFLQSSIHLWRKTVFEICFGIFLFIFWTAGSKEQTHCSSRMTHTIYIALVDNRWEIANYKALTWIKCTLQLVVMEPLNDLLNSLKSPSLRKAIHLSWSDIKKRKTWFFYKLKNKAARIWWWPVGNKTCERKNILVWEHVLFCLCTSDIYLCRLSRSNLPCCNWIQTNRLCCLKYCCNIQNSIYGIAQCHCRMWIISVSHLNVILF